MGLVSAVLLLLHSRGADYKLAGLAEFEAASDKLERGVVLPESLPLVFAENQPVPALWDDHLQNVLPMHLADLEAAVGPSADFG